jgi:cytohesin
MVEILLAANASPLPKSSDGITAYSAAEASGRRLVALMIAEATAIHAIETEDTESLLSSLADGAYVNIRNNVGWTPLIYAVVHGDAGAVAQVLKYGADPNRAENDGWTALHFAAMNGQEENVGLLMKAGARSQMRNLKGDTARDLALAEGFQNIADLLPEIEQEL